MKRSGDVRLMDPSPEYRAGYARGVEAALEMLMRWREEEERHLVPDDKILGAAVRAVRMIRDLHLQAEKEARKRK